MSRGGWNKGRARVPGSSWKKPILPLPPVLVPINVTRMDGKSSAMGGRGRRNSVYLGSRTALDALEYVATHAIMTPTASIADKRRRAIIKERGIQPRCRRCRRSCKVLDAIRSRLICFDFVLKEGQ